MNASLYYLALCAKRFSSEHRRGQASTVPPRPSPTTLHSVNSVRWPCQRRHPSLPWSWIYIYFHVVKRPIQDIEKKIRVSNVLDKQALCLLVQVQPLYNTFHLCICKALMMGSLRLWLLDCDQKKRFSPCLPCNPLRLEIVCPRVPLRYLGGLPPNTWVPKGGSQ